MTVSGCRQCASGNATIPPTLYSRKESKAFTDLLLLLLVCHSSPVSASLLKPPALPTPALRSQRSSRGMKRKTSPLPEEPAKKKPEADYVLNPEIFSPETRQRIKEELRDAAPYTHLRIPLLCDDNKMRGIHDELVHNLTANLKESDLFKVYQTCDLANLGRNGVMVDLAAQMPGLIALRDAIYSDEFREWVQVRILLVPLFAAKFATVSGLL